MNQIIFICILKISYNQWYVIQLIKAAFLVDGGCLITGRNCLLFANPGFWWSPCCLSFLFYVSVSILCRVLFVMSSLLFGHYIVCPAIYDFCLPVWYLQKLQRWKTTYLTLSSNHSFTTCNLSDIFDLVGSSQNIK